MTNFCIKMPDNGFLERYMYNLWFSLFWVIVILYYTVPDSRTFILSCSRSFSESKLLHKLKPQILSFLLVSKSEKKHMKMLSSSSSITFSIWKLDGKIIFV